MNRTGGSWAALSEDIFGATFGTRDTNTDALVPVQSNYVLAYGLDESGVLITDAHGEALPLPLEDQLPDGLLHSRGWTSYRIQSLP